MNIDLETYYTCYGPMVLRRCIKLLGDEDEAVDAMQEVFVRLLERAQKLEIEKPEAFLYCTATNICLNRIRADKRRIRANANAALVQIATFNIEARLGAKATLARLFGLQPEDTRTMAVLHYVDGMTLAQVAQMTDMSVSGVRKRLRKLKQQLLVLQEET